MEEVNLIVVFLAGIATGFVVGLVVVAVVGLAARRKRRALVRDMVRYAARSS